MLNAQQKFKSTPVGEIPVDWECVRIETLVQSLKAGVSVNGTKNSEQTNQVAVLKVSAVTEGEFKPEQSKTVIQEDLHRVKTPVTADRIIISRSNSQSLVGASAYVSRDYPDLYLSDKLWEIDCNELSQNKFLSIVLSSGRLRYRLSNLATGTSGSMKNISQGDLTTLPIALPPLAEQQKIADILSTGDRAIDTQRKLITALTQRKKALAQQLLTGKTRLPGFEEPWEEVKLSELLKFEPRETPKPQEPFLSAGLRSHGKGVFLKPDFEPASIALESLFMIREGDLMVNITFAWEGAIAIVPPKADKALTSHRFLTYTYPESLVRGYLEALIKSKRFVFECILASPGGAGRNRVLKKTDFLKIKIPLPPLDEQIAIAKVLTTADRELALHTQHLTTPPNPKTRIDATAPHWQSASCQLTEEKTVPPST